MWLLPVLDTKKTAKSSHQSITTQHQTSILHHYSCHNYCHLQQRAHNTNASNAKSAFNMLAIINIYLLFLTVTSKKEKNLRKDSHNIKEKKKDTPTRFPNAPLHHCKDFYSHASHHTTIIILSQSTTHPNKNNNLGSRTYANVTFKHKFNCHPLLSKMYLAQHECHSP